METKLNARTWGVVLGATTAVVAGVIWIGPMKAENEKNEPASAPASAGPTEQATVGGGCFWCTEAVFETIPGVHSVVSGYAGGGKENPTYEEVVTGRTGHAEVIQIKYDPALVTFPELLDVFWQAHDPTTLNRQGADRGTQYRSAIYYQSEAQRQQAEESKQKVASKFSDPIVTEIAPLKKFYPAEEYHQDYFKRNPNAPYCMVVIKPKLRKLKND
jgi:peptide-methionine (S)-S-oxide reductase